MSLEDALKAKAIALVSQQMANWVVAIQNQIRQHQGDLVKALDDLGESVARYDEQIDESQIEATILEALQGQVPAGGGGGVSLDRLKASMYQIETGANLSEVLTHLVNEVSQYVERVAIFIVKGNSAIGWYARGIAPADAVKQVNVPLNADTIFRNVAQGRAPLRISLSQSPGTAQVAARLGGSPQGVLAVPLILRDKVAAILYCDTQAPEVPASEGDQIEILAQFAGTVVDLISLTPKGSGRTTHAAKPSPGVQALRAGASTGRNRAVAPPPAPPAATDEGSSTVMFNAAQFAAMKQQAAPQPPPAAPARPSQALSPEDQKAHDDAKRFARLVVSEIKLYNEAKVNEGRRHKDLYERLKEDIERGRQMYADRVPPTVRDASNYFNDELIRILAGGDASALGL
jgi:hypothetical protein